LMSDDKEPMILGGVYSGLCYFEHSTAAWNDRRQSRFVVDLMPRTFTP
jgi:hypothetical protein